MEKLELHHLCGYLPYGLQLHETSRWTEQQTIFELTSLSTRKDAPINPTSGSKLFTDVKPLLIPLSELNGQNYIDFGEWVFGQHFEDFHGIGEAFEYLERIQKSPITDWPYGLVNELISMQYDVFGLIESGLALNKLSQS